jgi:hypothetical protein
MDYPLFSNPPDKPHSSFLGPLLYYSIWLLFLNQENSILIDNQPPTPDEEHGVWWYKIFLLYQPFVEIDPIIQSIVNFISNPMDCSTQM